MLDSFELSFSIHNYASARCKTGLETFADEQISTNSNKLLVSVNDVTS